MSSVNNKVVLRINYRYFEFIRNLYSYVKVRLDDEVYGDYELIKLSHEDYYKIKGVGVGSELYWCMSYVLPPKEKLIQSSKVFGVNPRLVFLEYNSKNIAGAKKTYLNLSSLYVWLELNNISYNMLDTFLNSTLFQEYSPKKLFAEKNLSSREENRLHFLQDYLDNSDYKIFYNFEFPPIFSEYLV